MHRFAIALIVLAACGRAGRNGAGGDDGGGGGGGHLDGGSEHLDGGGEHLDGGGEHLDGGGEHLDGGTDDRHHHRRTVHLRQRGCDRVSRDLGERRRHRVRHVRRQRLARPLARSHRRLRLRDRVHAVVRRSVLGAGGVALDDSDFIDIELSTVGVTTITSATLSIFGRSYDVDTSGSFNWQTFVDTGSAPTDLVSNVAPYAWYSADMTSALAPGDDGALIRIKAGPSSDSLVVNQIELCVQAN